jgi:transcriptional regulator with XRE-family HTH domain
MINSNKSYYKICREQAGLTQEQAIALLGIAEVATLSRYENGHAPVSQDLVASMVKIYRTPLLAYFHLRHANPDLAPFLPEVTHLITDGDAALQMEIADDDITLARQAVKAVLRDRFVSQEEAEVLKVNAHTLRGIANKLMSAASYLERREPDEND